jgi:hypothetical protein
MNSGIAFRPFTGTPRQPVARPTFAGRATFYSFLTRSSGLSKPSPLSLSFVGMRPASRPFAVFTPGRSRKVASPVSYADTHFIDACSAWVCLPDLRVLSLAARRAESQTPSEARVSAPGVFGAPPALCHSLSTPAESVESCLKWSMQSLCGNVSARLHRLQKKSFSSGGRCFSADVSRVLSTGFSP